MKSVIIQRVLRDAGRRGHFVDVWRCRGGRRIIVLPQFSLSFVTIRRANRAAEDQREYESDQFESADGDCNAENSVCLTLQCGDELVDAALEQKNNEIEIKADTQQNRLCNLIHK